MKLKVSIILLTFSYAYSTYWNRIKRLALHLSIQSSNIKLKSTGPIEWLGDLLFYVLDILLIPELYETIVMMIKFDYRLLSDNERRLAIEYFGKSINIDHIRINSQMVKRLKKYAHAYVTLNTINYHEKISPSIFIHELVHIWQYQRFGSMYIFRSLKAQRSKEKYDYGGLEGLYSGMIGQKRFIDFNFEQQGAIIEDFSILNLQAKSPASPIVMASYEYFASQLDYK